MLLFLQVGHAETSEGIPAPQQRAVFRLNSAICASGNILEAGVFELGESRDIHIEYENSENKSVTARIDSVSCGCLAYSGTEQTIASKQAGVIELRLDAPSVAGKFSASFVLSIDGGSFQIRLVGRVSPAMWIDGFELAPLDLLHPDFVGQGFPGKTEGTVIVRVREDARITLNDKIDMRPTRPGFEVARVDAASIKDGVGFLLNIQTNKEACLGSVRLVIKSRINESDYILEIPVKVGPWPLTVPVSVASNAGAGLMLAVDRKFDKWEFDLDCADISIIEGSHGGSAYMDHERDQGWSNKSEASFSMIYDKHRRYQMTIPKSVTKNPK